MNEYRKQQLRAAELIEQGATAEQVAAVYGWIRGEPEPIETGDKRTLTPRRKYGIIKAIRRYVNRWKQKQEGKTMNRNEIEQLAAEIRNSDTWIPELLEQLCEYAGMLDEWNKADGETFEEIAYAAAKKLNVEI